jgi:2,3-bisphosphoglycerate-independent phosphoglycerate mutase
LWHPEGDDGGRRSGQEPATAVLRFALVGEDVQMKTVMVIIDGLSDEPIAALDGKTPLEAAFVPNIHYIANRGRIGRIRTTFPGFPIESMICIMGLLGYEPERFYPGGRASFEAMAKGLHLDAGDLILRCNTVTADLEQNILTDFTAGLMTDSNARALIGQIDLPCPSWELYPGQSYRNILIIRRANLDPNKIRCFEPHMHLGKPLDALLPQTEDPQAQELVGRIRQFILNSQRQIASMEAAARCAANMLWVWSPSKKPVWSSFKERTGMSAAFVGGLDFLHGIAMAAGIHFDVIPGATGCIDTNYEAKADYTIKYLEDFDFVLTHINAADEEAHQRNYLGKIGAIERTDRFIIAPVLYQLEKRYGGDFRLIVCGDHGTRCIDGKHTDAPVPYAIYGSGIEAGNNPCLSEAACKDEVPLDSIDFLSHVCVAAEPQRAEPFGLRSDPTILVS